MYPTSIQLNASDDILILQTCSNHSKYKNYSKKYLSIVKLVENDKEKPLTSSYVATYRDDETGVQYIYYKVVGDVRDDVVSKKGSEVVTSSSQEVEYEINYRAIVDNYIGNASVLLVDSLPSKIDLEKSFLMVEFMMIMLKQLLGKLFLRILILI